MYKYIYIHIHSLKILLKRTARQKNKYSRGWYVDPFQNQWKKIMEQFASSEDLFDVDVPSFSQ